MVSGGDEWLAMTADGGGLSVHVECVYRVLVPKPLAGGWSIADVDSYLARDINREPRGWRARCFVEGCADDGSGIVVRLIKPAGPVPASFPLSPGRRATCYLTGIQLEGPANADWRAAFE